MLENLLWALELSQQCETFFDITVLQFVGRLLSGSMVGHTRRASHVCCSQSPYPCSRPLLTHASTGHTQILKGKSGSVLVGSLHPGAHKVLFELQLELVMEHQPVPNWARSTSRLHIVTLII